MINREVFLDAMNLIEDYEQYDPVWVFNSKKDTFSFFGYAMMLLDIDYSKHDLAVCFNFVNRSSAERSDLLEGLGIGEGELQDLERNMRSYGRGRRQNGMLPSLELKRQRSSQKAINFLKTFLRDKEET